MSAKIAGQEKARRLLEVEVDEVSLVDRAANLRQFLVIKRLIQEGKEMGAFDRETEIDVLKAIEDKDTNALRVWLEKMAENDEGVDREIVKTVSALVDELEKATAKEEKEEKEEKEKSKEKKEEKEKEKEEKGIETKKALTCPSCGASNPFGSKYCNACGAMMNKKEKGKEEKTETKKAAVQIMDDGEVIVSGEVVQKGKKFTANRTNTLKNVTTELLKLIGEVADAETIKSLIETLKAMPANPKYQQGVHAVGTKKSEDGKDDIKETIVELAKRIDKLEEARPAPTSEGAEETESKKVKKGLWEGIL